MPFSELRLKKEKEFSASKARIEQLALEGFKTNSEGERACNYSFWCFRVGRCKVRQSELSF